MTSSATITTRPDPSRLHLARLRAAVRGSVLTPDQAAFGDAIRAWNLNAVHRPAVAVLPVDTDDVAAAVRWAARAGIGVAVQATGHGTGRPCVGGLLLNTRLLQQVGIDPDRRRARVAAGVVWRDVVEAAAPYGLAGLPGSSATVGVIGSTLGGGFGWLGRRFGLAAHSVRSAEVVTAEGSVLRVSRDQHADLHWAVPGGLSGLSVVTRLEFALHPVPTVYAGNLFYPHERLADLLTYFAEWSRTVPDALTSAVTVRRFPPVPTVPEPLRGRVLVALRGCWSGDRREGAALVDQARSALGPATLDTFTTMPAARLAEISADPVDPLPSRNRHELLTDLTAPAIDDLLGLAGAGSSWPLVMTEVRQLGGALIGREDALSPMAHTRARFSLNAIGMTASPEQAAAVRSRLAALAERMAPHATGDTYLNFLDLDGATPERVRAAFSPADRRRLNALEHHYDPADVFRFGRRLTQENPS
ncbi:MAG TPA: FAD-binding oxidoreductase [Microlunatus sp.]